MHEWNLGWAGHIMHHSSPDYNMSVGVRGGAMDIAHVSGAQATAAAQRRMTRPAFGSMKHARLSPLPRPLSCLAG